MRTCSGTIQPAYAQWISSRWLSQMPGETTDFSMIEEAILESCASFDVQAVCYDPRSDTQLAQRMLERNVPMVEYPMTVSTMSELRWHCIRPFQDPIYISDIDCTNEMAHAGLTERSI
jgi:phage terminase large subunit-like protein